jgi:hypothetical protein
MAVIAAVIIPVGLYFTLARLSADPLSIAAILLAVVLAAVSGAILILEALAPVLYERLAYIERLRATSSELLNTLQQHGLLTPKDAAALATAEELYDAVEEQAPTAPLVEWIDAAQASRRGPKPKYRPYALRVVRRELTLREAAQEAYQAGIGNSEQAAYEGIRVQAKHLRSDPGIKNETPGSDPGDIDETSGQKQEL